MNKKLIWSIIIFILSLIIIILCTITLNTSSSTEQQSVSTTQTENEVITRDFLVYKRTLHFWEENESDIALRNEDMNVAATNPELYEFCKTRIGKTITVTFKKRDFSTFDIIKIQDKENKHAICNKSEER